MCDLTITTDEVAVVKGQTSGVGSFFGFFVFFFLFFFSDLLLSLDEDDFLFPFPPILGRTRTKKKIHSKLQASLRGEPLIRSS